MIYELQYHKDTLIDVRHDNGDGIPRGPFGEPKPWGSGEVKGDFRIEKLTLTEEAGEEFRAASMAHQGGIPDEEFTDESLVAMVLERKDDADFTARLKAIGVTFDAEAVRL